VESRILRLIAALRSNAVRVSLAESAEAFRAIEILGIGDRERFRLSLRSTLVKNSRDLPTFDRLFPLFFGIGEPPAMAASAFDQLSPEDAGRLAEALRQLADALRNRMQQIMDGTPLSGNDLERLGELAGLYRGRGSQSSDVLTRRMLQMLSFPDVSEALQELLQQLADVGMGDTQRQQILEAAAGNMKGLRDQVARFVGQRLAEESGATWEPSQLEGLMDRPFKSLSEAEKKALQHEVSRLAASLRTRIALRQKRAQKGQLDPKGTIRANLKYQGVPMELRHHVRVRKPQLVLMCDVSTSMRFCAELMLSLLYALQGQVSRTRSFAYIDHLESISEDLHGADAETAVRSVLRRMLPGHYNTDLGWSLCDFHREYLDTVSHATTLIVVGDGRNNYNDPRTDLFALLSRRAARTIWLNPEPPKYWTGDSDMPKYAPLCDDVLKVANVRELASAVDHLLTP
jgi:uncharacterized protein